MYKVLLFKFRHHLCKGSILCRIFMKSCENCQIFKMAICDPRSEVLWCDLSKSKKSANYFGISVSGFAPNLYSIDWE